jgi:hypothetical protein
VVARARTPHRFVRQAEAADYPQNGSRVADDQQMRAVYGRPLF